MRINEIDHGFWLFVLRMRRNSPLILKRPKDENAVQSDPGLVEPRCTRSITSETAQTPSDDSELTAIGDQTRMGWRKIYLD